MRPPREFRSRKRPPIKTQDHSYLRRKVLENEITERYFFLILSAANEASFNSGAEDVTEEDRRNKGQTDSAKMALPDETEA